MIHYKSIDPVDGYATWMTYHNDQLVGYITRRAMSHDTPYVYSRTVHGAKGFAKTRGEAAQALIDIREGPSV